MFDMIQNKESDMGIEIKEELDVDCTEISNQNFQKEFIQCDKPSTQTTVCSVKVEKVDTSGDQNIALNHVEIKQEKLDENVEIKQEEDPLSILSTNINNFDLPKLPADGSLKYVQCISCDKALKVSSKLEKDITCFKCLNSTHKCKICNKAFSSTRYLINHTKNVHEGGKNQFNTCDIKIKEELDVNFSEITNPKKIIQCGKPSTITTFSSVKVEKDDTCNDSKVSLDELHETPSASEKPTYGASKFVTNNQNFIPNSKISLKPKLDLDSSHFRKELDCQYENLRKLGRIQLTKIAKQIKYKTKDNFTLIYSMKKEELIQYVSKKAISTDESFIIFKQAYDNFHNINDKKTKKKENVKIEQETNPLPISSTNIDNTSLNGSFKYIQCMLCDKELKVSSKLEKDIKCFKCSNSKSLNSLSLRCNICSINFKTESSLNVHNTFIHEKAYVGESCDLCGQVFMAKRSLIHHIKIIHEGRKDYNCHLCNKDFTKECHLNTHIKTIHEGQKDYKCDVCYKDFSSVSHLKYHKNTVHEGRKDYKCDKCEKKFTHSSTLKIHVKTVHEGQKDFKCHLCNTGYATKIILNNHVKSIHKGIKTIKYMYY